LKDQEVQPYGWERLPPPACLAAGRACAEAPPRADCERVVEQLARPGIGAEVAAGQVSACESRKNRPRPHLPLGWVSRETMLRPQPTSGRRRRGKSTAWGRPGRCPAGLGPGAAGPPRTCAGPRGRQLPPRRCRAGATLGKLRLTRGTFIYLFFK
jgi:hypothetical protein